MPRPRNVAKSRNPKFPPEYARWQSEVPSRGMSGGGARSAAARVKPLAIYGYPNGDARLHRLGTIIFAGRVVQRWCVVA